MFVSLVESLRSLEPLSTEELAMTLARQYQEEVIQYQARMQSPPPGGPRVLPLSSSPLTSAPAPTPDEGWRAWRAIIDPAREEICLGYRDRPEAFVTAPGGVSLILRSLTRVEPAAPFLVTAAYLLWRRGFPGFCAEGTPTPGPAP